MENIVFLERGSVRANFRRPAFEHEWRDYQETAPEQILERLEHATIAITNKLALREAQLSLLPILKLIGVSATGVDVVDVEYCKRRGIGVTNVRNYARNSVPEHALTLLLALRRNLPGYSRDVRNGEWQHSTQFCLYKHQLRDLNDSTLGIVGCGALGKAMERLALGVGMRVLISEHKNAQVVRSGRTSFEEILAQSDAISLHCPLTPETRNLIGAAELGQMKPHAILINTARGGLVNEKALREALISGLIGGAGFDVLSSEPPRDGNVLLDPELPNFILTPHVAWASDEAMQILADQLIDNLEAFVRGHPQNLVT
jgi:glycerate dehydrogenase